jgi:ferric-dicitrate binding protein FerR (iron transport regulator)
MVVDALLVRDHGEALSEDIRAHAAECSQCDRAVRHLGFLEETLLSIASETLEPPPFQSVARKASSAASSRRRRRAMRSAFPFALAVGCAAAATAGVIAVVHRPERSKIAVAGEVLDASRGTVQALLADGARLTLGAGRVVVKRSERSHGLVRLEVGSVFLEVPHREKGATFVLETEDADVHVQGTRFDVSRGPEGTRVRVSEGMVTVQPGDAEQRPILVARGETALVEGVSQRRSRQLSIDLDALENAEKAGGAEVRVRQLLNEGPTLPRAAEAYARLAWRLSATGRTKEAIDCYRRALVVHTDGDAPLWADNAAAQLALVLERQDPAGAAPAWHEYLERFPGGVHAEIARLRIAGKGAPHR